MIDSFSSLKAFMKLDDVCIDNHIFRLHYKVTFIILMTFSLIVTSRQYIGDPIDCLVNDIPLAVMDTYCWIHSTFTVSNRLSKTVELEMAHPGVGVHIEGEDEIRYHTYYQWVCFVLFFQAILFHIPRYLWKIWEGGLMKRLVLDLICMVPEESKVIEKKEIVVQYFVSKERDHSVYAYRFLLCEVLNFINVVSQIFLMDAFLDGEFTRNGLDFILLRENRADSIDRMFPKVTKCTFRKFGPSGSVQTFDGLCVLPLNVVNEKIYIFLLFWFILLSFLTGFSLIYRLIVITRSDVRTYLLRARARFAAPDDISFISGNCLFGDWFVLYLLSENMNPCVCKKFMADLRKELDN